MKKPSKTSGGVIKKTAKPLSKSVKVDLNSLNDSFSELHRTKMTKNAAEARKAAKIIPVKDKLVVPSRETVNRTSDDLAKLLQDF